MKLIKRWTTGLVSRVDWMVSQVENQEALVGSAIKEVRQSLARAKVQLARVRQDGNKLRSRLADEHDAEGQWKERARKAAETDEDRAVECLRRSKRAGRLATELARRLEEHEGVEKQLHQDVRAVEERLSQLMEKRNLLRTRESRATALSTVRGVQAPLNGEVEEVFDRWETRVTEFEIEGDCSLADDPLLDRVGTEEEEEDLRQELADLRREQGGSQPDTGGGGQP